MRRHILASLATLTLATLALATLALAPTAFAQESEDGEDEEVTLTPTIIQLDPTPRSTVIQLGQQGDADAQGADDSESNDVTLTPTIIQIDPTPQSTVIQLNTRATVSGCVTALTWHFPERGSSVQTATVTFTVADAAQAMDVDINPHGQFARMIYRRANQSDGLRVREATTGAVGQQLSYDAGADLLLTPALEAARERVELEISATFDNGGAPPGRADFTVRYDRPCS